MNITISHDGGAIILRIEPLAGDRPVTIAGLAWDSSSAHSAVYDAERTAEPFCLICNRFRDSFLEAEARARSLGWLGEPAAEAESDSAPAT